MTQQEAMIMAVVFRIGERISLSVIIIVISFIVMIAFWRSVQRIELMTSGEKFGGAGTIVLSTPIFVLLALVGYTYISFSNPVAVSFGNGEKYDGAASGQENVSTGSFTGIAPEGAVSGEEQVNNTEFERHRAVEVVRSLNCMAGNLIGYSAQVQEDFDRAKLNILQPVWSVDWGTYESFADRVMGRVAKPPNGKALKVFNSRHEICTRLSG